MSEHLADVLFLVLPGAGILAVAALGVLALPWKDEELVATTRAVRAGWSHVERGLRRAGRRFSPRVRRLERSSVAFEPPSMPAA